MPFTLFIRPCLYREVMSSSLNQEVLISQDSTLNSFTNKQTPVVGIVFLQIVKFICYSLVHLVLPNTEELISQSIEDPVDAPGHCKPQVP